MSNQFVTQSRNIAVAVATYIALTVNGMPPQEHMVPETCSTTAQSSLDRVQILTDPHARKRMRFQALALQWRSERGAMSSTTEMVMLPAYQKIIGMGEDAIPLILSELRSEGNDPDQWFWALSAITEATPVKAEDRGNFRRMAQAWFKWAEDEGYAG